MIAAISGTITGTTKKTVFVQTASGVTYEIMLAPTHHVEQRVETQGSFPTFLRITESSQELFGFRTFEERDFFVLLLSVSGVGPKSAMNILSLGSLDEIRTAIARQDVKYLTAVQGMGKKTAERLVVELKNKIGDHKTSTKSGGTKEGDVLSDVIDGLTAMGYSTDDAKAAAMACETTGKTVEQVLKEALRQLAI